LLFTRYIQTTQSPVKSIRKCKKKSLYNQPKPYFIIKQNHIFLFFLLWSHFWINFNIFYTKTFGIVYILFFYLLIMFIWVVFIGAKFFPDFLFHSHMSKVFGNVKRQSLYNQPKPYFFKKLLRSHFWIDFKKYCTKTLLVQNFSLIFYF
jgi:hypothetical protein